MERELEAGVSFILEICGFEFRLAMPFSVRSTGGWTPGWERELAIRIARADELA
jgi:hypothetical protein